MKCTVRSLNVTGFGAWKIHGEIALRDEWRDVLSQLDITWSVAAGESENMHTPLANRTREARDSVAVRKSGPSGGISVGVQYLWFNLQCQLYNAASTMGWE